MFVCLCVDLFVVFFFFFKQKTAYEIVSRDWSSDVCSSDLATCLLLFHQIQFWMRLMFFSNDIVEIHVACYVPLE